MYKQCVFIFLMATNLCFSQTYGLIKNFNSENGLPSDLVYTIVFDKEGYAWIGTDKGVVKYNGTFFKIFQKNEKMPTNDIFEITIDSKNRKWILGYFNGLYYIEDDIVKKVKNSECLNSAKLNFEKNNELYFNSLNTVYCLTKDMVLKKVSNKIIDYDYASKNYIYIDSNNYLYKNKKKLTLLRLNKSPLSFGPNKIYTCNEYFTNNYSILKNGLYVIKENKVTNILDENSALKNRKIRILSIRNSNYLFILNDKNIFFAYKNGILDKNLSERISKLPIDLNKTIVLNIDSNENIWYIFENLSLYKVPKNYELIKNLNFNLLLKNATPTSTITIGDFVYILTNDSELYSLQLKTKKLKLIKKYSNNRPLLLKQYNDKLIVCFADFMDLYKFKNNNLIHVKEILNSDYKDAIFFNNKLYYINLKEIFDDSKRRILIDSSTPRFKGLIGLNNNIIVYNEEKIISYSLLTKKRISTNALKTINLAEKSNNVIFFGTYSNGLYVLTQNLEIIQKIDFKRKSINKLYYDSTFDILYVGTNEGVFTYKVKKNKLQFIKSINIDDRKFNKNILSINTLNNSIIVSTLNGISIIDKKIFDEKVKGEIDIDQLIHNDSTYYSFKDLNFKRNENSLTISTSIKTNNTFKNFQCYYSLTKVNSKDNWVKYTNKNLSFNDLGSGDYIFKAYTTTNSNLKGKIKSINFSIAPYFWERRWVQALFVLFAVFSIILTTNYFKDKRLKKSNLELKLVTLEMKLLKAQMNPHFIFNIINTLQSSVILEDEIKVNKLFSDFSKLMRLTLNIINSDSISLKDEIEYLENYTRLENIRKNNEVNIVFYIQQNLDLSIKIPVMLTQPIIENVFIHAFTQKQSKKDLLINFYSNKNYVYIEIEDNGVGMGNKVSNKKSYALNIIQKRLEILNKIKHINNRVDIINLETELKKGTKVILRLEMK